MSMQFLPPPPPHHKMLEPSLTEGDQIEMKRNVVYGVSTEGDQIEMKRNVAYGVSTEGDQIEMSIMWCMGCLQEEIR